MGQKKILVHFDRHVIFAQYFDHIWPAILYRAWSCAGQRAHDSKCLNDVYEAYRINHILYKKFLVKPNWVKIRQILGGQYCPPLDLTLIWKLGPDRVKLSIVISFIFIIIIEINISCKFLGLVAPKNVLKFDLYLSIYYVLK